MYPSFFAWVFLLLALLLCVASTANGALPPQYEGELFCPHGMCLRRDARLPAGWSGSHTRFYQCVRLDGGAPPEPPRAWGTALDPDIKRQYLADGLCNAEPCPTEKPWANLLLAPPYISGASRLGL